MNFVSVDSGNVWHVTSAQKIFVNELTKNTHRCIWVIVTRVYQAFFLKDFIYLFDRQITSRHRGRQREKGGSRLPAEQRAGCGARFQDAGILT